MVPAMVVLPPHRSMPSASGRMVTVILLLANASNTLSQPVFPGLLGSNYGLPSGSLQASDPNFRPPAVDSIDFTIQRQINNKITLEIGYIGRRYHP